MSLPPPWPFDSREQAQEYLGESEWERAKSPAEWRRFYARSIPIREQLADFAAWQMYFAKADLCYIEHGILPRPCAEQLAALEHVARELDRDPRLLATLWLLHKQGDLGIGEARREAVKRAIAIFKMSGGAR